MRFGHFDDGAREYVVETPATPYPWINYLGHEGFFSLISHLGGGYSFYQDAKLRRLTRYRYNNIPTDAGGRYFYLRDGEDVWNPTWLPIKAQLDFFETRHGFGYTTIAAARGGVKAESLFFVPLGERAEVQRLRLTNESGKDKELSVFSLTEFCLWNASDDQENYQRNLSLAEVEVEGSAIYHKTEYRERRNHYAVYGVNAPLAGFDTDRETFVGGFETLAEARVPRAGESGNSIASGWYPIGSHHVKVTLAPGESRDVIFVLGYCENPEEDKWQAPGIIRKDEARALLGRFATTGQVDDALARLREYWDSLLSTFQLTAKDAKLARQVGLWNQYQCMVTFNMSRSASYFETGIGRGMGFRDSNQDLLGFVHLIPQRARERICDIAATQLPDGSAYHQYQPLTKRGNDAIGSGFNDDPLWLILGVSAYLKETGDDALLSEMVPFDNEEGSEAPLFEHLTRSFNHVLANLGPHGLPLIGRADWNDCLNLNCFSTTPGESFQTTENKAGGTAESVMIAAMFCFIGPEYAAMARLRGLEDEARRAEDEIGKMRERVIEHGWDGQWFLRAYDNDGNPVGSHRNDDGQIYIEPQGFCAMAGIGAEQGLVTQALAATEERLATEHGLVILDPPYSRYHVELGEISTYPPGYKENGGVFSHSNPWVIIGEALSGSVERAWRYYRAITPAWREEISEIHRLEPYVYAQMIAGKAAPRQGEAKNSWLSGTAAWAFTAVSQYLLGIRPSYDALIIDPRLEEGTGPVTVTRKWRGATYVIEIDGSVAPGQARLTVDGAPLPGNKVPPAPAGTTVTIQVS